MLPVKTTHEQLTHHLKTVEKSLAITSRRIEEHEFILAKEQHDHCTIDGVQQQMRELFEESDQKQRKLKTMTVAMQAKSMEQENRLETAL